MQQIIIDKQGNLIEVVDLQMAISQVIDYMGYIKENPQQEEKKALADRQSYWADLYRKLKHLETKQENHEKS